MACRNHFLCLEHGFKQWIGVCFVLCVFLFVYYHASCFPRRTTGSSISWSQSEARPQQAGEQWGFSPSINTTITL